MSVMLQPHLIASVIHECCLISTKPHLKPLLIILHMKFQLLLVSVFGSTIEIKPQATPGVRRKHYPFDCCRMNVGSRPKLQVEG